MHGLDLLAHQLPHNRRELEDARHAKVVQAAIGTLRLDNRVVVSAISDVHGERAEARNIDRHIFGRQIACDILDPHRAHTMALDCVGSMSPAGTSALKRPGVRGWINPFSSPKVTIPIVPWPHIGRQPLVSMKRIPMSASSLTGG